MSSNKNVLLFLLLACCMFLLLHVIHGALQVEQDCSHLCLQLRGGWAKVGPSIPSAGQQVADRLGPGPIQTRTDVAQAHLAHKALLVVLLTTGTTVFGLQERSVGFLAGKRFPKRNGKGVYVARLIVLLTEGHFGCHEW